MKATHDPQALADLCERADLYVGDGYGFVHVEKGPLTDRFTLGGGEYDDRIGIARELRKTFDLTDLEADAWAAAVYGAAVAHVRTR